MSSQTKTLRPPAVAGQFYSQHGDRLQGDVRSFLKAAKLPELARVRAVIAPHAGYPCSGPVAGYSFAALGGQTVGHVTVYLLGPAHWRPVFGVGLCNVDAFLLPTGEVAVDHARVQQMVALGEPYRLATEAHMPEHCLEVELPFLQMVLSDFAVVPMLLDNDADPARVGADLAGLVAGDPASLIVVSSDLSHYHNYAAATAMDHSFLAAVVAGDIKQAANGEACGLPAILTLMHVAARLQWRAQLLAYANSGDTCGPRRDVVGYGAVAYTSS